MAKVVLGGGLSGLSAAYYLFKNLPKQPVTILESSNRLGGWVKSNVLNDGTIFEQGPRTIRPQGESGSNTLSLVEDLGLENEIVPILSTHAAVNNRMIYANGQLHSLPSSLASLFKAQPPFSKPFIRYLMQDLFAVKKTVTDESIYDFTSRRFGKDVADYLVSAFICGICAGNAKEVSVKFLMKQLFEYEQQYGSISNGLVRNFFKKRKTFDAIGLPLRAKQERWRIYSFKNGLETLPKQLESYIRQNNIDVVLNSYCNNLEVSGSGAVLHLSNGRSIQAEHVISSIPSAKLAEILQKQHPNLSDMLRNIKSVTVGVVNLCYDRRLLRSEGFGFLVPPKENVPILGVIYDSCCFPKGDKTVLTVMIGGHWFERLFGKNPGEDLLLQTAKDQLSDILGISEEPTHFKVNILRKCIPQYVVGHEENLKNVNEYISTNKLPISLCGASYYGVGVNDVILSARNAVEDLCNKKES